MEEPLDCTGIKPADLRVVETWSGAEGEQQEAVDVMTPEIWQHQQVPQLAGQLETIRHQPWSASRAGTLPNSS